jgi:hypothetical protein
MMQRTVRLDVHIASLDGSPSGGTALQRTAFVYTGLQRRTKTEKHRLAVDEGDEGDQGDTRAEGTLRSLGYAPLTLMQMAWPALGRAHQEPEDIILGSCYETFEQERSTLAIIFDLQIADLTTSGYFFDVGRHAYCKSSKRQLRSNASFVLAFLPLFMWHVCTIKAETFVILHTPLKRPGPGRNSRTRTTSVEGH